MPQHRIEIEGPGATGTVVSARMLRAVLDVLIEGSQQAVRLRTQGRSRAGGTPPRWIRASADFRMEIKRGSTVIDIEAPSLFEADPDQFTQVTLFPELDPNRTSLDYLQDAAAAALGGDADADLYDAGLLETLRGLDRVFESGAQGISLARESRGARRVSFTAEALVGLRRLEESIPLPRQVKVAGILDGLRHSDRTFSVLVPPGDRALRGVARDEHLAALQAMWGQAILVSGLAHFTAAGKVQRIEAEQIRPATARDLEIWTVPEPVTRPWTAAEVRVEQGPRSGLAAILGRWPGDESEDEVREVLERMS